MSIENQSYFCEKYKSENCGQTLTKLKLNKLKLMLFHGVSCQFTSKVFWKKRPRIYLWLLQLSILNTEIIILNLVWDFCLTNKNTSSLIQNKDLVVISNLFQISFLLRCHQWFFGCEHRDIFNCAYTEKPGSI